MLFLLWLHPFILSRFISPLISSSILGTYRSGEFIFQFPIFSPCYTVHGALKAKILKWVCHSLLQCTTFCQSFPPWPIHLEWPDMAWLSFIELDKAVVHVVRLASCLWLWFQSVCPITPFLSAYHLIWFCLTLDVGYLFMAALANYSHCSLPWTWGSSTWPRFLDSMEVWKSENGIIDAFELWCWRRHLRVPWTAKRSNILKEISPECSLEGLILKLKLQYFGYLMWRTDSTENTLMLG